MKIIALDFDGTILNSSHVLSNDLSNTLHKFQEEGGLVILSTGRSLSGVMEFEEELGINKFSGFIICYNGAEIYTYNKGEKKRVFQTYFSHDEATNLVDKVKNHVHTIVTYSDEYISANHVNDYVKRGAKLLGKKINNDLYHQTPKLLIYEEPHKKDQVFGKITEILKEEQLNLFSSAPHAIEITPLIATKGNGIKFLCEKYNLDINEIYCFGDSENDISMFEVCGKPIAMGNAIEELKKISIEICLSNELDGVYNYLKDNWEKK